MMATPLEKAMQYLWRHSECDKLEISVQHYRTLLLVVDHAQCVTECFPKQRRKEISALRTAIDEFENTKPE